jgi:hypothetical protein
METGMGRRVFVGSVVAGLPLLASPAARIAAQSSSGSTHIHADGVATDPVLDHIARQLAGIHNAMRRQPRGEHMRAVAAQLRTLAVYGRQIDVDSRMRSLVGALVKRDGRDGVLYLQPDAERVRADLKRFGAEPDEKLLRAPITLDYAARSAALNRLLQSGLSVQWERMAALLDRMAPGIDERASTVIRVRQDDPDYWEGYCTQLWSEYSEAQFLSGVLCASALLPVIGIGFAVFCIAYQLAAVILAVIYAGYCWNVGFFF